MKIFQDAKEYFLKEERLPDVIVFAICVTCLAIIMVLGIK